MADEAKRLGDEAFKSKDYDKAIEQYTEAIKENPRNGSQSKHVLLSNRSAAHAASKNWDKALEDAVACIQAKPDFSKAWSRKGAALMGKGDAAGALKAYKRCIEIDPANSAAKGELQRLELDQAQRSAAFSNIGAKASAQGNAASSQAPLPLQLVVLLALLVALASSLQFIMAADPTQARFMFQRVAMSCMFAFFLEGLARHGTPNVGTAKNLYKAVRGTASQQDVQGIFNFAMDENTHMIFYCSLLFSTMPGLLLLFPIMPLVLISFAKHAKRIVARISSISAVLAPQLDKILAMETTMQRTSSNSEVVILVVLIFEIFTPRRNLMLLILFIQLLRVRFLVNANSRAAWITFEGYLDGVLMHAKSPGFVQSAYTKVKGFVQSNVIPKK